MISRNFGNFIRRSLDEQLASTDTLADCKLQFISWSTCELLFVYLDISLALDLYLDVKENQPPGQVCHFCRSSGPGIQCLLKVKEAD